MMRELAGTVGVAHDMAQVPIRWAFRATSMADCPAAGNGKSISNRTEISRSDRIVRNTLLVLTASPEMPCIKRLIEAPAGEDPRGVRLGHFKRMGRDGHDRTGCRPT